MLIIYYIMYIFNKYKLCDIIINMLGKHIILLGIETSCDETAASVCIDGKYVLSNIISSQISTHKIYGGVVPEIASRLHIDCIDYVVKAALDDANIKLSDVDAICATKGPGLSGALLVGYSFAKALSYANNIKLISVNHLMAHIASNYLITKVNSIDEIKNIENNKLENESITLPYICLLVSGGHTSLLLVHDKKTIETIGSTIDDAAGEAFDKVARALGLQYPGGPQIEKYASMYTDKNSSFANLFPRGEVKDRPYDFTFSGLKSAVLNYINKNKIDISKEDEIIKIAYAFQESVFDSLISRAISLAKDKNIKTIALAGGVAANKTLRKRLNSACMSNNIKSFVPNLSWTTDNAAMICAEGFIHFHEKENNYISSDIILD